MDPGTLGMGSIERQDIVYKKYETVREEAGNVEETQELKKKSELERKCRMCIIVVIISESAGCFA